MSAGDWKDMLLAVQNGRIEIVKYHIENGVNPNYEHPELFTTALIESIFHEEVEIAKYLLENGADPKLESGFSKESPLNMSKRVKNRALVKLIKSYIPKSNCSILSRLMTRDQY